MAIEEYLYIGSNNSINIGVASSDTETPLAGVDRITVRFVGIDVLVDSDVDVGAIDWTSTEITITIDNLPVLVCVPQDVIIKVYDVLHPLGQTIAHPDGPEDAQLKITVAY